MAFDTHKNLAYSLVATAPSPADSGTSLVVTAGQGTRFPTVPFNATVWPVSSIPTPDNAEIVRVTGISTDTLTITRAQESTTARSIVVGDQIAATVTAKSLTDIENLFSGAGAYTSYAATLTNVTEGNGTKVANYLQIGDLVHYWGSFVLGSTSDVTGLITISLPVNINGDAFVAGENYEFGTAHIQNTGVEAYPATLSVASVSTITIYALAAGGTYLTLAATSGTVPFNWNGVSGNSFSWDIIYPAA